jgi:hypothetical protein
MQGHLDDLLLHVRRLPGVGLFQEKRPSAIRTRPAPIPLLTFWSRALPNDISPVTVWTMQRLGNHGTLPHKVGGARLPTEDSRSTALKHLPLMFRPAGLLTTPVAPTHRASPWPPPPRLERGASPEEDRRIGGSGVRRPWWCHVVSEALRRQHAPGGDVR